MDAHLFGSLAHVQVLLLPVGKISRTTFDKFTAEVRSFEQLRLGDIPSDNKDERARFMPSPLSTGHLHLSYTTSPPSPSHYPLALFRPSHFPLAVIGVASCSQSESLAEILAIFNESLTEVFPYGSLFPLAKNCFLFEEGDGTANINLGDSLPGLIVIPNMMGNKKLYIGTLLADLCSHIIGEFGVLVQTLESPLGNEYLNSGILPNLPPSSDAPRSSNGNFKRDSLPPLPSQISQSEPDALDLKLSTIRRTSTAGGLPNRQNTLGVQPPKKRQSGVGAASSHGRLFKILGDFFLLSGRTNDAQVWYQEAIALFKLPQDTIWHASALEGLATLSVAEVWSSGHGLNASNGDSKEPWNQVSEKLSQATALYQRGSSHEQEQHYPLLTYLYCSSNLRQAAFLFAVWSSKGWGPLAFTAMIQTSTYLPPTILEGGPDALLVLERLSVVSGVSRSAIASILAQVHGPWLLHLRPSDRISVLESLAGYYACIGFKRKEAYILREILGCVMDLIVCGREEVEDPNGPTAQSQVGLGLQGASDGYSRGSVSIRKNESTQGNESILRILKYACRVLGINLDAVRVFDASQTGLGDSENGDAPANLRENEDDTTESFGWPELQVGVTRESVAVAEALPDFPAVAQFALSSLKTLHQVLDTADQYHLYTTALRALSTAKRRGNFKQVEYWSGKPIIDISLSPVPLMRLAVEKPRSLLESASSVINPVIPGSIDPFLYNPRKLSTQGKTLIVQNEPIEFVITLWNPYVFDLEIQKLTLSTTGVTFDSQPVATVIPASSYHSVSINGRPLESGTLTIKGCSVQAPGGVAKEFVIPLLTIEEEDRRTKKRGVAECEKGRFKYPGLQFFPWERESKRPTSQASAVPQEQRFLECQVIPEQPLMRIRRTTITHGALMLYDGEVAVLRITVENVSKLTVNTLRIAAEDSTTEPAQQALAEGDLSVFDTYETEYELIHKPVFSWEDLNDPQEIGPGQKATLTISCFGKVGCTEGAIHVSYSSVDRSDTSQGVFYTRQLSYPVMVTVYQMLECQGMDVLLYSPHSSGLPKNDSEILPKASLKVEDQMRWSLFSIEVRNNYGLPFEVIFERKQEGTAEAIASVVVAPGSTSRIILPIRKFLLPHEHSSRTIPTLSDRQFVVTNSGLTAEEERTQRELFWYREELFKLIRGRWREAGGVRCGDLSLRKQRLTLPMLEALKTEVSRVELELMQPGNEEQAVEQRRGKYHPAPNEFFCLRIKVTNTSLSSRILTVDLAMSPAEHIIFEGPLQNIPIGRLQCNEARVVETTVCFLSLGQFEVSAKALEVGTHQNAKGFGWGTLRAEVVGS